MKCKNNNAHSACDSCGECRHCNQWISLNKEPPPMGEWVLVLTDGRGIYKSRKIWNKFPLDYYPNDWMLPAYLRDDCVFTHWMPLPKLPSDLPLYFDEVSKTPSEEIMDNVKIRLKKGFLACSTPGDESGMD